MTEKLNIPALRQFAEAIQRDPQILFSDELTFLRSALSQFGELKAPAKPAAKAASGHAHSHGHGDAHGHSGCSHDHKGHDHSGHDHGQSHGHGGKSAHQGGHQDDSSSEEEEEPVVEEPEEEDPERLIAESEPVLAIPAGGEGELLCGCCGLSKLFFYSIRLGCCC
jgi:hypothetical protein